MTTRTRYPAPSSAPAQRPRLRLSALSVAHCLLAVLALLLVALLTLRAIPAYDLYWQLKTGEVIASTRHVPHTDLFSYTAYGDPWYVQEWLSEVVFYDLWKTLGKESLLFLRVGVDGELVTFDMPDFKVGAEYHASASRCSRRGARRIFSTAGRK